MQLIDDRVAANHEQYTPHIKLSVVFVVKF